MIATRLQEEQLAVFQPAAMLDSRSSSLIPWEEAHKLLQEIEDLVRLVRENAQDGVEPVHRLTGRVQVILKALEQAHLELDRQVTKRTAELSEANALLKRELTAIGLAERRLAAEHAVARILVESSRLADAAPRILQAISQSLRWDVGSLWTIDADAEMLRCMEVWHGSTVAIPAFEQVSRHQAFPKGTGLPGAVWASAGPIWIPDVTQDSTFSRAPIAAKEGLHAAVGFPIGNGTEILGVMEFFSSEIRQPDAELLQMMTSIGSHISQFIDRRKAERSLILKQAEIGIARVIQQGLLAKAPPTVEGFEVAGICHPATETSGDYFDFFTLLGGCQGIAVADATGHGLGPALLITETRAYLRALALTNADIGRIVTLANRRLVEDIQNDHFVTLFLARLDPIARSLHYIGCGHPSACILDSSGSVKALLESASPPLGVIPDADFPIGPALTLQSGDLVLFVTDGVIEARAPDNSEFGFQRAIEVVRACRRDTAVRIVENLYDAVRAYSHNYPQVDDITVVVIKLQVVC
jgi:serine phosphatase RsbU (regulator of sigma subunit)